MIRYARTLFTTLLILCISALAGCHHSEPGPTGAQAISRAQVASEAVPERVEPLCRVVFDFESDDELAAWSSSKPALLTFERDDRWSASGDACLRATYRTPWPNWPSLQLVRPNDDTEAPHPKLIEFFRLFDSGEYEDMVLTIRNPADHVRFILVGHVPFQLAPDSVTPLRVSIDQLAEHDHSGDASKVGSIGITGNPPLEEPFDLFIDAVGFASFPDNAAYHAHRVAGEAKAHAAQTGADRFVLATESPMRHVFVEPHRYQPVFGNHCELKAARNESESFQLVAVPFDGDLEDVTWEVKNPANAVGNELPAWVRVVGYVKTQPSVRIANNPNGAWFPDLLVDADRIGRLRGDRFLNLWVKVYVPAEAEPGSYQGKITVKARNAASQSVDLDVQVWPFTLPTRPSLPLACALKHKYYDNSLERIYSPDQIPVMRRKFEDRFLGEYRMDINNIYRTTPPFHWDADRIKELVENGLTLLHMGYFPTRSQHVYEIDPNVTNRIDEIREYLDTTVKDAGAREMCYFYGFDEAHGDDIARLYEAADTLKEAFPDIPFLTTANSYQYIKGALAPEAKSVDWWTPILTQCSNPPGPGNIKKARALGHKVWYYVCNASPWPNPNFDIELSPAAPRLLFGAMAHFFDTAGFLYYAINDYHANGVPVDVRRLPYVGWNANTYNQPDAYNGQGYLAAPGEDGPIPTIRLEMVADGIEDHLYYHLLSQMGRTGERAARIGDRLKLESNYVYSTDPAGIEHERVRLAYAISKLAPEYPNVLPAPDATRRTILERLIAGRETCSVPGANLPPPAPPQLPFELDPTKPYKLRVDLPGGRRLLNLVEIEAFREDQNLTRGRPVRVHPKHPHTERQAENLVDGLSGLDAPHAASQWVVAPYAEIDLAPSDRIDRIVIWNRPQSWGTSDRLLTVDVKILDETGAEIWGHRIQHAPTITRRQTRAGDTRFQRLVIEQSGAE